MVEIVESDIFQCYDIRNNKINTKNGFCCIIRNKMNLFNAEAFAVWMREGFENSTHKSFRRLAKAVKSSPATISRLMNAAPQTNTNKPSQPEPELVKKLAIAFNKDVNEALILAGHAPETQDEVPMEIREALSNNPISDKQSKLIAKMIKLVAEWNEGEDTPVGNDDVYELTDRKPDPEHKPKKIIK